MFGRRVLLFSKKVVAKDRMIINPLAIIPTLLLSTNKLSTVRAFSSKPNQTTPTSTTAMGSSLSSIELDNSWIAQLSPETEENLKKSKRIEGIRDDDNNNKSRRPIYNGHYVLVKPTGLKDPKLLLISDDVAHNLLNLSQEQMNSSEFLDYVSGNTVIGPTWATPYALSIMGTRYTSNCPYGTGNGYGDGRAIAIGEFHGHELQLKGAGQTPFCRGADGRAVLRSSIREFLASEAMHALGIGTTRALSLVVSSKDTTGRPWYAEGAKIQIPELDDPRLAKYSMEERKKLVAQLRDEKVDPNIMIEESCAITCRVAPSFVRVGHLDLFARRVNKKSITNVFGDKTDSNEYKELEELIWHACYREFKDTAYTPFKEKDDLDSAARALLQGSADRLSTMVTEWIRVGFAQGNFNADNCLISGNTMDYGPFGFMEEYSPGFAKWTGSGEHFSFMNQPQAGLVNYKVLVESVLPVIQGSNVEEFLDQAIPLFALKLKQVFRRKLGFDVDADAADGLWDTLKPLLQLNRVDWSLFWRQLTLVAREFDDYESDNYDAMLTLLEGEDEASPFYQPLSTESRASFKSWIEEWRSALATTTQQQRTPDDIAEGMRLANPKYVLREWMLKKAYDNAAKGDYAEMKNLYALTKSPYEEGTSQQESQYYRRTPAEAYLAGGTAFMS